MWYNSERIPRPSTFDNNWQHTKIHHSAVDSFSNTAIAKLRLAEIRLRPFNKPPNSNLNSGRREVRFDCLHNAIQACAKV